jgi:hypothetical protein
MQQNTLEIKKWDNSCIFSAHFSNKDGSSIFLRNAGIYLTNHYDVSTQQTNIHFCFEDTHRGGNPVQIIYEDSVRTAKKTQHFTVTKINRLTLFEEIIAVYSENHTKHTNTFRGQNA